MSTDVASDRPLVTLCCRQSIFKSTLCASASKYISLPPQCEASYFPHFFAPVGVGYLTLLQSGKTDLSMKRELTLTHRAIVGIR